MKLAILALLVVVTVVVAAVVVYAAALAHRSAAQLEAGMAPAPGMPANAPISWAGAHTSEARMHRRLSSLARDLAAVPLGDACAIERRSAVEECIRDLDRRLIELAAAPEDVRREAVAAMRPDVDAAAAEVGALATQPPWG